MLFFYLLFIHILTSCCYSCPQLSFPVGLDLNVLTLLAEYFGVVKITRTHAAYLDCLPKEFSFLFSCFGFLLSACFFRDDVLFTPFCKADCVKLMLN